MSATFDGTFLISLFYERRLLVQKWVIRMRGWNVLLNQQEDVRGC